MKRQEHTWAAANILEEANSCAKHLTQLYNTAANEAGDDNICQDFLNILMDEHQLQKDILTVMQRRGLPMPPAADSKEIAEAERKFSQKEK